MTLLKYCGNRSFEDYVLVKDSLASHIGFIFVPGSKRAVTAQEVSSWLDAAPVKKGKKLVGVFVNPTLEELQEHVEKLPLDVIQLHGTESPDLIEALKGFFYGEVWKVIHHGEGALEKMTEYQGLVQGFLIDSKSSGAWGGTGKTFDWDSIPSYMDDAHSLGVPCWVAGGITPENIASLLELQPDGIDLASGIERDEKKSAELIQELERKVGSK